MYLLPPRSCEYLRESADAQRCGETENRGTGGVGAQKADASTWEIHLHDWKRSAISGDIPHHATTQASYPSDLDLLSCLQF